MSEEKYVPNSKIGQWFDSRLPLLTLSAHLREYPTPKNLNYWWTFGGILTFFFNYSNCNRHYSCYVLCSACRPSF